MESNSYKIEEIRIHTNRIDALQAVLFHLVDAQKYFNQFFPNHVFPSTESTMISTEIQLLKEKIKQTSNSIEKETSLDVAELTKTVLDAWNRTKIKTSIYDSEEIEDEFEEAQDIFLKSCGFKIEQKDLQIIEYTLKVKTLSSLSLVQVFMIPGFSFAKLSTGNYNWSTEVLVNDNFLQELVSEINS